MKKIKYIFLAVVLICITTAGEKRVLIEVLTNSHCPLCVQAHSAIESYFVNGNNKEKIDVIYYHMIFPYSDDQFYQANTADAAARNNYYGPFSSTPKTFFDGSNQGVSYSNWPGVLDSYSQKSAPFEISLSGNESESSLEITANISREGVVSMSDLRIHFVLVENVNYSGRNGISDHKNVMRKMITGSDGMNFILQDNNNIEIKKSVELDNLWIKENLSVVVFIQSQASKEVYQSNNISYNQFQYTSVDDFENEIPNQFLLNQNYPNPFNPTTTIQYSIPNSGFVEMKVFNIFGEEVHKLVEGYQEAGTYSVNFDAAGLSSGTYFYNMKMGDFSSTKKMIILK